MDQEWRNKAKSKIVEAKNMERRGAEKSNVIESYFQAINFLMQIQNKNLGDILDISDTYYGIAVLYFNAKDYENSASNYVQAINQLQQTELNDVIYRKLTERYIDLADACYEMKNQSAGDEAMNNAIKAFGLIQIKSREEQQIGDPVKNFAKFHLYYEKQLSTSSYLASNIFKNHEDLLAERQRLRQEEHALFQQFESISIGEMQQIELSIESMMAQLSFDAKPMFTPVMFNQQPSDESYRAMAMQLLSLAQNHFKKQSISDGIATYKQVINTLNTMNKPNESDRQIIQNLQQQIEFLQKKPLLSGVPRSSAMPVLQRAYAETRLNFFGNSNSNEHLDSAKNEAEDCEMSW